MSEIDMIETRPNRIELKPLTNKYRGSYNHWTNWTSSMRQNLIPQQRFIIL